MYTTVTLFCFCLWGIEAHTHKWIVSMTVQSKEQTKELVPVYEPYSVCLENLKCSQPLGVLNIDAKILKPPFWYFILIIKMYWITRACFQLWLIWILWNLLLVKRFFCLHLVGALQVLALLFSHLCCRSELLTALITQLIPTAILNGRSEGTHFGLFPCLRSAQWRGLEGLFLPSRRDSLWFPTPCWAEKINEYDFTLPLSQPFGCVS